MATRQVLTEEFLTCIICREVFRDPVTLHCGHTFCTHCITSFTKTQADAIRQGCIPCPNCRGVTKVPDPKKSVDEWSGQLKTGFFVKGLVEKFAVEAGEEDYCSVCKDDGETKPAVVWCSSCSHALCTDCNKVHSKLNKSHEVNQIPALTDKSTSKQSDILSEHDRHIEQKKKELEKEVFTVESEISAYQTLKMKLLDSADQAELEVEAASHKLISKIHEKKNQLKEDLNLIKTRTLQSIHTDITSAETRLENIKQKQDILSKALTSKDVISRHEAYTLLATTSKSTKLRETESQRFDLIFNDTSDAIIELLDQNNFGYMMDKKPDTRIEPRLTSKLNTALIGITGITVMYPQGIQTIVVCSALSRRIKSFSTNLLEQTESVLECKEQAYGLTKINDTRAAVSLFAPKQILFFNVGSDLVRGGVIQTNKKYICLTCLDSKRLAATAQCPGVVDVISMDGSVLRSFGFGFLQVPTCISVGKNDNLLVSEERRAKILSMDYYGNVKFVFEVSKSYPKGCFQNVQGEVFFVDSKTNKVVELTENGQYVQDLLTGKDGLIDPDVVFVDGNQMYVSCGQAVNVYQYRS